MPSHLRPRPGTASAVGRLSIGRLVGEQCNFDQSSIVARMSSRAMQNGRSWVKKRNLGQKNETLAEKTGFSALFLSVSIERGGEWLLRWQVLVSARQLTHYTVFYTETTVGEHKAVFMQIAPLSVTIASVIWYSRLPSRQHSSSLAHRASRSVHLHH